MELPISAEVNKDRLEICLLNISKSFFLIYFILILRQLLPINIFDLDWIQGVIATLIYNAAIPLGGLAFLMIQSLFTSQPRTRRLLQFATRWVSLAAIGFLLLIPLQGYVVLEGLNRHQATARAEVEAFSSQFNTFTQQITTAATKKDLLAEINSLPRALVARISTLPLEDARQEILAGIEAERTKFKSRQRYQLRAVSWKAAKQMVGNSLAALVLAWVLFNARLLRISKLLFDPYLHES